MIKKRFVKEDLIITSSAYKLIKEIKIQLSQEFEMKYLGELHYCLGILLRKDRVDVVILVKLKKSIDQIWCRIIVVN